MKTITLLSLLVTLILGSCATSNEVAGGGILQKRKYNSGIYWNKKSNLKESTAKNEEVEFDIFKGEERKAKKFVGSTTLITENATEIDVLFEENVEEQEVINTSNTATDDLKQVDTETNHSSNQTPETVLNDEQKSVIKEDNSATIVGDKKKSGNMQNNSANDMFVLAVIFAILIPPLGVGIYTNIDWTKVLICLLLTILFFLPGMIYALLVVFDVI